MSTTNPSFEDALRQAIDHHRARRFHEAEVLYRAILREHPANPDANHNLGLLAVEAGRHAQALPFFRAAAESHPSFPQFRVSLATALLDTGDRAGALQALDDAAAQGVKAEALDVLRQRLGQVGAVDRLMASLQAMVASGQLVEPGTIGNRAQRRAAARQKPAGRRRRS
ncbi:tetratricopeptide repeat protein [Ramlibacter sp.]|uniref:tetratricopeptide repeat protein n=1 Tax=Ramlibacter sp. TaxID=1917967 RepID=UPI003D143287